MGSQCGLLPAPAGIVNIGFRRNRMNEDLYLFKANVRLADFRGSGHWLGIMTSVLRKAGRTAQAVGADVGEAPGYGEEALPRLLTSVPVEAVTITTSRRAAEPPSRRAAEPPSRRARGGVLAFRHPRTATAGRIRPSLPTGFRPAPGRNPGASSVAPAGNWVCSACRRAAGAERTGSADGAASGSRRCCCWRCSPASCRRRRRRIRRTRHQFLLSWDTQCSIRTGELKRARLSRLP